MKVKSEVLCVDLDGTFTPTDTIVECSFSLFRKSLIDFLRFIFIFFLKGRGKAKVFLADRIMLRTESMPLTAGILEYLIAAKNSGKYKKIVLATGSAQKYADAVKNYFPVFDESWGTTEIVNLTGRRKAALLSKQYPDGFDYIGNSSVDLKVWSSAKRSLTANCSEILRRRIVGKSELGRHFGHGGEPTAKTLMKAVRAYQWPKNLLILVPIFLGNKWLNLDAISLSLLGFLSMSLLASSFYLINDMFDMRDDRMHPQKCKRPLASGDLGILHAGALSIALAALGLGGGFYLDYQFGLCLLIYSALTNAYTFEFKRVPLLDVFILASLFILRLVAGALLVDVYLSHWLIVFSVFFFLSLALCKRFTEVQALSEKQLTRGYYKRDQAFILTLGVGATLMSALVISLYISSVNALGIYNLPQVLWSVNVILLFWALRIWFITSRGEMFHDPVSFAIKDKVSLLCGFLILLFWSEARVGFIMGSLF